MALLSTVQEYAEFDPDFVHEIRAGLGRIAEDLRLMGQGQKDKVVEFFAVDSAEPVLGASFGSARSFDMTFWPRTGKSKCTCARFKNGQLCEHLAALYSYVLGELALPLAAEAGELDRQIQALKNQLGAKGLPLRQASELAPKEQAFLQQPLAKTLLLCDLEDLQTLRERLYLPLRTTREDLIQRALGRYNPYQLRDFLSESSWQKICDRAGIEFESPLQALQDCLVWEKQGSAFVRTARENQRRERAQKELAELEEILGQSFSPVSLNGRSLSYGLAFESRRRAVVQVFQKDEKGQILKEFSAAEIQKLPLRDFKYVSDLDRKILSCLGLQQSLHLQQEVRWFSFFKLLRGTDLLAGEWGPTPVHSGFAWLDPVWHEDPLGLSLKAELSYAGSSRVLGEQWCILGQGPFYVWDPLSGIYALDLEWPEHLLPLWNKEVQVAPEGYDALRPQIQQTALRGIKLSPSFVPEEIALPCKGLLELELDPQQRLLQVQFSLDYGPAGKLSPGHRGPALFVHENGALKSLLRDEECEKELALTFSRALRDLGDESLQRDLCTSSPELQRRLVLEFLPQLEQRGFHIQGWERVQHLRVRKGKLKLGLASGEDFFELKGAVDFGMEALSLGTLMKQAKGGKQILLRDGSVGELAETLWQRLEILHQVAEKKGDQLLIHPWHLPLLQELDEFYSKEEPSALELMSKWESKGPEIAVPSSFCGVLRPYQLEGLNWMENLARQGMGGLLADDMGLGKTIQVIAWICHLFEQDPEAPSVLIVAPASLLSNWKAELIRFAPHLELHVLHGAQRMTTALSAPQGAVFLTTYGILQRDTAFLNQSHFSLAVLDEAQAIKNPHTMSFRAAKRIRASRRLCLTGTPVENHLLDLWAQMNFLNPGLLGKESFFAGKLARPVAMGDRGSLLRLRALVHPFWLRRTKEEVLSDLPELEEVELRLALAPKQEILYQRLLGEYRSHLLGMIEEQGLEGENRFQVLRALLRLRQVALAPELAGYKGPSAKLDLLQERLGAEVEAGHKVLIFSSFSQALDLVEVGLKAQGLDYLRLDGSTPVAQRAERVARFQDPQGPALFLISLKAGGVGLNLTAADYVYLLDPWWNPAIEAQAAARAHRLGQKRSVVFYRLLAENTVEDKILSLSRRKSELAREILAPAEAGFELSPEMLRDLFEA